MITHEDTFKNANSSEAKGSRWAIEYASGNSQERNTSTITGQLSKAPYWMRRHFMKEPSGSRISSVCATSLSRMMAMKDFTVSLP